MLGAEGDPLRGLSTALLVSDLPFGADASPERAFEASLRFLQAGAAMVKLEGAAAPNAPAAEATAPGAPSDTTAAP